MAKLPWLMSHDGNRYRTAMEGRERIRNRAVIHDSDMKADALMVDQGIRSLSALHKPSRRCEFASQFLSVRPLSTHGPGEGRILFSTIPVPKPCGIVMKIWRNHRNAPRYNRPFRRAKGPNCKAANIQ
jgi:hypothetical protein